MKKYSTLIIDDDIENINILKIYLKKYCPFIEVVSEASNVSDGIREFAITKPEILLLDIDLGGDTIFSFIDSIGNIEGEVIFISSHTEYGVKAVNYNVTGFIVKPIEVNKLQKIINKAIFNLENRQKETKSVEYSAHIAIPTVQKVELVPKDSLVYLEADGKYTVFHLIEGKEKIASRNLGEYEKILDPKMFFRIHHRYLVNVNMIANVHKDDGGYCELLNGKHLPIAKRRQDLFNKFLKLK